MADISYHHGTRVFEKNNGSVPIRTVQSAVIALLGTAPNAKAATFPLNEPVLIKGFEDSSIAADLGDEGTLPDALAAALKQIGTYIYLIRIDEGDDPSATIANAVGDAAAMTGVHALKRVEPKYGRKLQPRLVAAPGLTSALSSDGIAAYNLSSGGSGYSDKPTVNVAGDGYGAQIEAIVNDAGAVSSLIIVKPGHGYTSAAIEITDATGTGAAATATIGTVGSPVAHEMVGILEEMRAVAFIDGPSDSDENAVKYATFFGSDRLVVVAPQGMVWDNTLSTPGYVSRPLSAHFCGVQAKVDKELGFHESVSNKAINGVDQASRPVLYGLQTNYLNENNVATIFNTGNGWRTWGSRTTSAESAWAFLNVRRVADFINIGLADGLMEYIDKIPSKGVLEQLNASARNFMERMTAEGYILGGTAYYESRYNKSDDTKSGRWTISVEFEPAAPIEDLRVIAYREPLYYDRLVDGIVNSISDGALAAGKVAS